MKKILSQSKPGKGSVVLISALLIASASVRVFTSATQTSAAEEKIDIQEAAQVELPLVPEDRIAPSTPLEPQQVMTLIDALNIREKQVAEREEKALVEAERLRIAKAEIEAQLAKLESAEKQLRSTIALADEAAENDLARLTTVYENMKPKDAAALFEEMDPQFAAGFVGRMRPDAAASILAGLSPQVAYSISAILAGRNAETPTK